MPFTSRNKPTYSLLIWWSFRLNGMPWKSQTMMKSQTLGLHTFPFHSFNNLLLIKSLLLSHILHLILMATCGGGRAGSIFSSLWMGNMLLRTLKHVASSLVFSNCNRWGWNPGLFTSRAHSYHDTPWLIHEQDLLPSCNRKKIIYSFMKYLLSVWYILDCVIGTEDLRWIKDDSCPQGTRNLLWETNK